MNIDPAAIEQQTVNKADGDIGNQKTGFMKWLPLLVMSLALAIIILDTTILNVTLRTIVVDLHTTLQKIQWVITAYSLMLAAFTITGGRLGDLFGRKKMFIVGAVIFAIGSFMTSISHSVGFMIAGEAIIEGIGACLMMPATLSLLRSNYKGRDMQMAFGIWGGIVAGAAALGPVIGGWFTQHYTWRWAFRVNVAVALILVVTSVFIQEYRDKEEKSSIDFIGVLLSALGMLSMVFGFIQATTYGWWHQQAPLVVFNHALNLGGLSATPVFIALGVIILGLFLLWEGHMEKKGRTPLVSPDLFQNKTFMTGTGVSAILSLGQAGLSFSIPVYLQAVLKLDPIHTGLAMIPMTAVILIAAPLSAWVSKFLSPKRIIQIGIVLDALGFVVLRQSLHVGANQWALAPGFTLFGMGLGLMMAQSSNLTLSAVSVEQSGEASGVTNTIRSLGQTLGSAIMGAILLSSLAANITEGIQSSSVIPQAAKSSITQAVASQTSNLEFGTATNLTAKIPSTIANELVSITNQATVLGNKTALGYGLLFIVLAFLVSFGLPKGEDIKEQSLAHHEMIPRRRARIAVAVTAVVIAAAAGTAGYSIAKHKYDGMAVHAATSAATQSALQTQAATPALINQNPDDTQRSIPYTTEPAPEQVSTATTSSTVATSTLSQTVMPIKTFSDSKLHFSVAIPQDWTVKQLNDQDIIIAPDGQQYSIQENAVGSSDPNALKDFLTRQSNVRSIAAVRVNGLDGFSFTINGPYKQGWATVQNGKLYYLLGQNITQSVIAQSFQVN